MTAQLLRGAPVATGLRREIAEGISRLRALGGGPPVLATLAVGEVPAAAAYRAAITRTAGRIGIEHIPRSLPPDTSPDALVGALAELNGDDRVTGVLVLLPLPPHLPARLLLETLSPLKDVDGITPTNVGRLHLGLPSLRPSTPQGGLEILDFYRIDPAHMDAVIVGRSNVVGQPLASLLLQRHATVTICHRQTSDLAAFTRRADLLAVAAGRPGLITGAMVKPGAVVLDFGVNIVDGAIRGDVDFESVVRVAGAITPVPGGTGPVTALVLMRNTVAAGFAVRAGDLDHVALAELSAGPRL